MERSALMRNPLTKYILILFIFYLNYGISKDDSPNLVPLDIIKVPEGLEVTIWASSPMLYNPTNIDIDKDGRIWVAEGVRYRFNWNRQPQGDRIVVLEDTNKDGKADKSHTFLQDPSLVSPLGIAVIDNKIVVSQPPELIVYTDVNRNLKFEKNIDTREILLNGFSGKNHDHSLHSVTVGPNGKWYFNSGNCGAEFTDRSGLTYRIGSPYNPDPIGPFNFPIDPTRISGEKSDDGHIYVGGFTARMNPDATEVEIIGYNYRNSYEQSISSIGDVFQSDNDDPPACRVSYVLEYGNAGFASTDGKRTWRADKRPNQSIAQAQWRQEDPGTMPAGDIYGGGSPTGNVFYENGALGEKWKGMFLACEAGKNVVFGYFPKLRGAGFDLERFNFITTNEEEDFAGTDFLGGGKSVSGELKTLFRPSDIAIGPDGAIYISDWYDGRVGGHQDLDKTMSGTIYRVAPKNFISNPPKLNLSNDKGAISALKSPAVNVRNLGFMALKERGEAAVPQLTKLLKEENIFLASRAIWLLSEAGKKGYKKVYSLLDSPNEQIRITAYRALRSHQDKILSLAKKMSTDESPAVRREVAISLRDISAIEKIPILVEIAKRYPVNDRTYLEAFGIGSKGAEGELFEVLNKIIGNENSLKWSNSFCDIAWRLHPIEAIKAQKLRGQTLHISKSKRKQSIDALAFTNSKQAAIAMMELAKHPDPFTKDYSNWWLLNKVHGDWNKFNLEKELADRDIYDPSKIKLIEVISKNPSDTETNYPSIDELLTIKGSNAKGKILIQRCTSCHQIGNTGINFGPSLTDWGGNQTRKAIFQSIINPNLDIAHGFEGYEIELKNGKKIHGLLIKESNPYIILSEGGVKQIVNGERINKINRLNHSLMTSPYELKLNSQDIADIVAFLKNPIK
tara:strand:- start:1234 stop:3948 length:2715 start_codon:yes stop_codon:yes gene_type:complete